MGCSYLNAVQEDDQRVNNLFRFLGVKILKISPEEVVLTLPLSENFLQGNRFTSGGILATLMDEAMAHVVMAHIGGATNIATIDMTVRFFRSVKDGELTARGTIKKAGKRVVFVHSVVTEQEQLIADSDASFMIMKE